MKLETILLGLKVLSASAELPSIALKQKSTGERTFIETAHGREVFFHGVNAIVKGFPYIPDTETFDIDISMSELDHQTLSDLGVNVYRLGSMWKGVEPIRGEYNETYLKVMGEIVASAESYGIYTILDMHQDDFSEKFCGEGVPDWAAISTLNDESQGFPSPLDAAYTDKSEIDGFPTRQDCAKYNWPSYYNTKACASAFQNLYTNTDGLLDSWGQFWAKLASTYGDLNAILGYELINEPWPGDTVEDLKLFIPNHADKAYLQGAYDSLAQDIRKIDSETLIFFAAVTWDDIIPVGFEHPPGGEENAATSVFAYHYYEPPQLDQYTYFRARTNDAKRLHVASMLTEFERSTSDSQNTTDGFVKTADACDSHLQSWTMWEYKTFCKETEETLNSDSQAALFGSCKTGYGEHLIWSDNGTQNMEASRKLARTYARAVAGSTQSMSFNTTTGDFRMKFSVDTSIDAPTEIFAHYTLNYPSGIDINVFPLHSLTWEKVSKNMIAFYATDKIQDGAEVIITISRM